MFLPCLYFRSITEERLGLELLFTGPILRFSCSSLIMSYLRPHNVGDERFFKKSMSSSIFQFAEKGVKGVSWAFSMPSFDIINGMCLDYMHAGT